MEGNKVSNKQLTALCSDKHAVRVALTGALTAKPVFTVPSSRVVSSAFRIEQSVYRAVG